MIKRFRTTQVQYDQVVEHAFEIQTPIQQCSIMSTDSKHIDFKKELNRMNVRFKNHQYQIKTKFSHRFLKTIGFLSATLLMSVSLVHAASIQKDYLPENAFIGLTFHDVRDDVLKQGDKDLYAISTQNLVQYFEWLKQSKWHPVTLKEIMHAKKTGQALPENSVVISFDDGALSSYTHVYPLLKQYKIPAVFAIVTSWTNGNTQAAYEAYGQGNLMTWAQMREMQQSGLVEFASHSDDLHKGILANPQKNQEPAALTHQYFPLEKRYETDQEYQQRIFKDLVKSKEVLRKELGIDSLAIIWPYGAVSSQTEKIAEQAGYPLSFSLGIDSLNHKNDGTFQRGLVMNNPSAEDIRQQMTEFVNYSKQHNFEPVRAMGLDLKQLEANSIEEGNQKLGLALNQISAVATNALVVNVLQDENQDGTYDHAYFPTQHLAVAQDLLNRVAWQAKTRVFNRVTAKLPFYPDPKQPLLILDLAEDLVKNNKGIDGIMLNANDRLQCLLEQSKAGKTLQDLSNPCQQQLNQLFELSQGIQQRTYPYLNISNHQKFSIQLKVQPTLSVNVQNAVTALQKNYSLINFEIDSVHQPQFFKSFMQGIEKLNVHDKAMVMVTLNNQQLKGSKQWQQLQQDLMRLQSVGIQKLGISEYSLINAKKIHKYLYKPLSLNPSPLLYRDPFQIELKQGVKP